MRIMSFLTQRIGTIFCLFLLPFCLIDEHIYFLAQLLRIANVQDFLANTEQFSSFTVNQRLPARLWCNWRSLSWRTTFCFDRKFREQSHFIIRASWMWFASDCYCIEWVVVESQLMSNMQIFLFVLSIKWNMKVSSQVSWMQTWVAELYAWLNVCVCVWLVGSVGQRREHKEETVPQTGVSNRGPVGS